MLSIHGNVYGEVKSRCDELAAMDLSPDKAFLTAHQSAGAATTD